MHIEVRIHHVEPSLAPCSSPHIVVHFTLIVLLLVPFGNSILLVSILLVQELSHHVLPSLEGPWLQLISLISICLSLPGRLIQLLQILGCQPHWQHILLLFLLLLEVHLPLRETSPLSHLRLSSETRGLSPLQVPNYVLLHRFSKGHWVRKRHCIFSRYC